MASISFHTDSEIISIGYKEGFDATCISISVTHRLSKDHVYSRDWLLLHGTADSHRAFAQAILDATEGKDVRVQQVSILPPEITDPRDEEERVFDAAAEYQVPVFTPERAE